MKQLFRLKKVSKKFQKSFKKIRILSRYTLSLSINKKSYKPKKERKWQKESM
jgi:hypothetical protein